jgi:AhpD family alkylhydroperoxidase
MQSRMTNPALILPDATQPIQALLAVIYRSGVPRKTLGLVHLRASQINGCAACVDDGARRMKMEGETDERLAGVAVWREMPYFDDAERAALSLTEAMTRMSDSSDPVPDAVWGEAVRHFDERAVAGLILMVAITNLFNRINVTTRQVPGPVPSWEAKKPEPEAAHAR